MDFLINIGNRLYPLGSAAVLAGSMLISIFFGLSGRKATKKAIAIISAISMAAAFYFNIYGYLARGDFSNFLLDFNLLHVILTGTILFCALNLLLDISIYKMGSDNFIKLIIILLFATIVLVFLIISSNFIMIFISFSLFTLAVFQLLTGLNPRVKETGEHLSRFSLTALLSLILLFFGFSILFSGTDITNIRQFLEPGNMPGSLIAFSAVVFAAAIYLYFFIFPFQGPYLKLVRRIDHTSLSVIWFFYFPAGIFILFKFSGLFYFFLEKNGHFASVILFALSFLAMTAANVGAIRTSSLRRILAFLFLFFMAVFLLGGAVFSSGIAGRTEVEWLNLFVLLLLVLGYLPVYGTAAILEMQKGTDTIKNFRGLLKSNTYISINLIFIFLSWLVIAGGVIPFMLYGNNGTVFGPGVLKTSSFLAVMALIAFLALNIFRVIIELFRKQEEHKVEKKVIFPKYFYIYITIFTLILIGITVAGLFVVSKVDIGIINFEFTGFNIFDANSNWI